MRKKQETAHTSNIKQGNTRSIEEVVHEIQKISDMQ